MVDTKYLIRKFFMMENVFFYFFFFYQTLHGTKSHSKCTFTHGISLLCDISNLNLIHRVQLPKLLNNNEND